MYKESQTLELKKSLSQLKEGVISLSSMLNKANKGTVYFGIDDDSKIVGLQIGKKTLADITYEIQNNLKPLPTKILVNPEKIDDKTIIRVDVEGFDTPYSAYGRFCIRVNDADIIMHNQLLQHFFENKIDDYSKWENEETKYTVDDIDEDLLIEYIRIANDKNRMDYVYRNALEALTKLGLICDNGMLNNAGWYLFGNNKPLTIKEGFYPTDSRSDFGEIKEYSGNIFECIKEATSYIQSHISYKSNIIGIQREDIPEIPLRAIREIVINSFAHCSYAQKGDYNTITIFKSSVRIYNPGSILNNIDPKRFASGMVRSKIRNILIASTLFKNGYIDAFGTGFDRTFTLCAKENIKYKYINDEFGFTFIFERKKDFLNGVKIEKHINKVDEEIIALLNVNKYLNIPELSKQIGKSEPTIHRHLDYLCDNNHIKRIGSRKTGYWKVLI